MRPLSRLLFLISACLLSVVTWALLIAEPRFSAYALVGDDAGYYFGIARNFVLGHGLSYDRLHETNGFNPLLTGLLIVTYKLFVPSLSVIDCYRAGILLTLLANLGSLFFLLRLLDRMLDAEVFTPDRRRLALATAAALFSGFLALKSNYGMDAPLVLLIGLAYLDRVGRHGLLAPGPRAAFLDGVLLAALFLARVDTLPFLVACFAFMALLALGPPARWLAILGRGGVAAAFTAPYLVWSTSHFGLWLPVSARLKSRFPQLDLPSSMDVVLNSSLNPADLGSFALAFLLALGTAFWFAGQLRHRSVAEVLREPRLAVIAVLAAYLLMRLTYMAAFSRFDVQGSYVILAHVFNLIIVFVVARAFAQRVGANDSATRSRVVWAACAGVLLVTAGLMVGKGLALHRTWSSTETGGRGDELALGQAIHAHTQPTDVIYGGAYGLVGFFADRAWINGDGVANTPAYQHVLEAGGLEGYLAEKRVTHVAYVRENGVTWVDGRATLTVRSELNGRVNHYSVAAADSVLDWLSLRNGGCTVALARYSPVQDARSAR